MSYEAARARALEHDSGWPTTPEAALADSAAAAKTTVLDDTLVLYSFDFSTLPDSISVKGIVVRLDGLKDHAGGSGDLRLSVELSWDSGSTWTSAKSTPLLDLSSKTMVLGGRDDAWGRSWTRAELVGSGTFRARVKAAYDSVTSNPTWHLAYLSATVIYTQTPSDAIELPETVTISEEVESNIDAVEIYERIDIFDGGSRPSSTLVVDRPMQNVVAGGTVVSSLESDADFAASAARAGAKEGIGIFLQLDTFGPSFYIGDATVASMASSGTYPMDWMQPGLLALGEIKREADFLSGPTIPSLELAISNRLYVDQSDSASATPKLMSTHAAAAGSVPTAVGRTIIVWMFVESGDGWKKKVLFNGEVEDIEFRESEVVVRALQVGTSSKVIPDIVVDEDLFDYEPGSSALETGEEVEGNRGVAVPIGVGRFDYGAVKKPADFPAGHPFRANFEAGPPSEDAKNYTNIALFPAMFGLKHPMMPTVHVAKNYRRINSDGTSETKFTSLPYQNVFLWGSRRGSPAISVGVGPKDTSREQVFPGADLSSGYNRSTYNLLDYVLMFTWDGESAQPFVAPRQRFWFSSDAVSFVPTYARNHSSAGVMARLGQPTPIYSRAWSDGVAREAYGLFVNDRVPRLNAFLPGVTNWPNALQTVALKMVGPTLYETAPAVIRNPTTFIRSPIFRTTEGTGLGYAENPGNAQDLLKAEAYTRLQNTGFLSLQAPVRANSRGKIRGVRFCMLWNNSTSTAQNVYLLARMGPEANYAIDVGYDTNHEEYGRDFGATHDSVDFGTGGFVPVYKVASVSGTPFASLWILPFFDSVKQRPDILFTTESGSMTTNETAYIHPWRKGRVEWQFTSMDPIFIDDWREWREWPWDFMLTVKDESGGVPIAGRYIDVYAVWMEVVYESPASGKTQPFVVETLSRETEDVYGYDVRGRRAGPFQNTLRVPFGVEFPDRTVEGRYSPVFVTGKGPVDESGDVTGTTGKIVENPVDVAALLVKHYLGDVVFGQRAVGSAFGSFVTARTLVGGDSYRMSFVATELDTMFNVCKKIGSQTKSMIMEVLDASGNLQWVSIADDVDPETNDSARVFSGPYADEFHWDFFVKGSFNARPSSIEDLYSSVKVRYGFHLPSRTWSNESYVSPTASNFAADASTYIAAMAETEREHRVSRQLTIDAPDIWDPTAAEDLCKWYADRVRRRYVMVEFETYRNGVDLQPGHVIKIHDDVQDRVAFPATLGAWSVHQFNVIQVSIRKDVGQLARVYVRALETYSAAA